VLPASLTDHADRYWTLRNKLIRRATINSTFSVVASFVSVVLALSAVIVTINTQRQLKEIDLRQNFLKRYDELVFEVKPRTMSAPANSDDEKKAAQLMAFSYYHRFWDLQLEEYQFWREGLIDKQIYASWMDFRRSEMQNNESLQGISYRQAWDEMTKYLKGRERPALNYYSEFINFMDGVFQGKSESYENGPR
jgi:hypothetical protein